MNLERYVGVDLGTGSAKAVVVDGEGRFLASGSAEYTGWDVQQRWHEQDPEAILAAMVAAVRQALKQVDEDRGHYLGLSLCGAQHNVLALDDHDRPLTGVITWTDSRAALQAQVARSQDGGLGLYRQTGCPPHAMYPLYKIAWLREEHPETFKKARRFASAKEYTFRCLSGDWLVDYCIAGSSGLLNTHTLDYNPDSLAFAGIQAGQLSALGDPRTSFPGIDADLATQMGLPAGIPLVLGSSDAANSAIGAGAVLPWQATCMVGTSGALRIIAPQPLLDRLGRSFCYVIDHDHWLVGGALNNGGVALAWLRDTLNGVFGDEDRRQLSFDDLVNLAGAAPPGAAGLVCLPFFTGERSPNWNSNVRAAFVGLSLEHRAGHLARALLEGVAYRLRSIYDVLAEVSATAGIEMREIRAVGGFTHSPLWMAIVASSLERLLSIPSTGESSSLAAAWWAMLGTGRLARLEEAADWTVIDSYQAPEPVMAAVYRQLYPLYLEIYKNMLGSFERLSDFQRGVFI
jgi:gluconokinase